MRNTGLISTHQVLQLSIIYNIIRRAPGEHFKPNTPTNFIFYVHVPKPLVTNSCDAIT